MKRKIDREAKLPPIMVDIDALDSLITDLRTHIEEPAVVAITVKVPGEELWFSNCDELRECTELPHRLKKVHLAIYNFSQKDRTINISRGFWGGLSVRASADSPAWCAGATEIVKRFAVSNRRWYAWIDRRILAAAIILVVLTPVAFVGWNGKLSTRAETIYLATIGLLVILFVMKEEMLAPFTVTTQRKEALWRRYSTELLLVFALIPVLFLIGGLLFNLVGRK